MIRFLTTFSIILVSGYASFGQSEKEVELDFPEIPSSPAFILMDISPSEIESPQTPSDVLLSVQNSSNSLTSVPQDYFVNVAPYWIFNQKALSWDDYQKGDIENAWNNVLQTFQFSLGISDDLSDDTFDRRIGTGFNLSLIRGTISNETQRDYNALIDQYHDQIIEIDSAVSRNVEVIRLDAEIWALLEVKDPNDPTVLLKMAELENLKNSLAKKDSEIAKAKEEELDRLANRMKDYEFTRKGFFWNVAGGYAWNQSEDGSTTEPYRRGLWTTMGFQDEKIDWMGVARLLTYDSIAYVNSESGFIDSDELTSIDFGVKFDYQPAGKVQISGEFLYRQIPNSDFDDTYRAVLNASYSLSDDIKLNLTYGKDFDVFLNGDANYLALINLAFGIGTTRKISDLSEKIGLEK